MLERGRESEIARQTYKRLLRAEGEITDLSWFVKKALPFVEKARCTCLVLKDGGTKVRLCERCRLLADIKKFRIMEIV